MKSHVNREIAIYSFFLEHSYFLFSPKVNSQNLKRKGEKVKIKNFQYFKFEKKEFLFLNLIFFNLTQKTTTTKNYREFSLCFVDYLYCREVESEFMKKK